MPPVTTSESQRFSPLAPLILAAMLAGCTVGPNFKTPAAPGNPRFTEAPLPIKTVSAASSAGMGPNGVGPNGVSQEFGVARDIPGEWWALFQPPQITALVAQALKANPDIAAAQATLRQARENTRASVPNADAALLPGMYTGVSIATAAPRALVTIPTAAVAYNPYGSLVHLVQTGKDDKGNDRQTVKRQFVITGDARGDQVSIVKGVGANDEVVTAG